MSQSTDIVQGGGIVTALGWALSGWAWLTGGMSPLAVLATLLTIALTALKLRDAVQRKRLGKSLDSAAVPLDE